MLNGTGIRVVLWVAGCPHHCKGCQNPITWDADGGIPFDQDAVDELFEELKKDYCCGVTFSGGDPLSENNVLTVINLAKEIKDKFPTKNIWLYTGYTWEEIYYREIARILLYIDVLVDGPYIEEQRDISLQWRGSKNQRIIDVQESLKQGKIITLQND
jgi:anaerobic ribonucleoside-triphosphate reductase activating protein